MTANRSFSINVDTLCLIFFFSREKHDIVGYIINPLYRHSLKVEMAAAPEKLAYLLAKRSELGSDVQLEIDALQEQVLHLYAQV